VDLDAGTGLHALPGEPVTAGQPLFTLHTDTPERLPAALAELDGAWSIGANPPPVRPLILGRVPR